MRDLHSPDGQRGEELKGMPSDLKSKTKLEKTSKHKTHWVHTYLLKLRSKLSLILIHLRSDLNSFKKIK